MTSSGEHTSKTRSAGVRIRALRARSAVAERFESSPRRLVEARRAAAPERGHPGLHRLEFTPEPSELVDRFTCEVPLLSRVLAKIEEQRRSILLLDELPAAGDPAGEGRSPEVAVRQRPARRPPLSFSERHETASDELPWRREIAELEQRGRQVDVPHRCLDDAGREPSRSLDDEGQVHELLEARVAVLETTLLRFERFKLCYSISSKAGYARRSQLVFAMFVMKRLLYMMSANKRLIHAHEVDVCDVTHELKELNLRPRRLCNELVHAMRRRHVRLFSAKIARSFVHGLATIAQNEKSAVHRCRQT